MAWSKYSSNTKNKRSKNFKITKKQKTTKSEDEHKIVEKSEDEEFNQFLEVMRPKTSLKQFVKGEKEQPLSKIDKTSPKNDPENDKNLSLKSTRKKRIFVLNIPYSATEKEIADFFSVYGNIEEVHLPQDMLNRSKGFCFVRFVDTNSVQKILTEQKVIFQGRLLRIKVAANNPNENFDVFTLKFLH